MPWTCCDDTSLEDNAPCAECGKTKRSWTLKFKKTRVFKIGRKKKLEIELLDPEGEAVPNEPDVLIPVAGGDRVEGELDDQGKATITGLRGDYVLKFPEREPAELDGILWIHLLDPKGEPLANEPYEVEDSEGKTVSGETDASGHAVVTDLAKGECTLRLPERDLAEQYLAARAKH